MPNHRGQIVELAAQAKSHKMKAQQPSPGHTSGARSFPEPDRSGTTHVVTPG